MLDGLPSRVDDGPTGLSPDFEALRWFPLPPACLPAPEAARWTRIGAGCRKSRQSGPMTLGGIYPSGYFSDR